MLDAVALWRRSKLNTGAKDMQIAAMSTEMIWSYGLWNFATDSESPRNGR
jgi:hypothetical protein